MKSQTMPTASDDIPGDLLKRVVGARRLMTLEALAEELGVGIGVVRGMRQNGLPGYCPPGTKRLLVDRDEAFDWIQEHRS